MSFAQRITAAEQRLNALRDQLAAHWEKTDETNVSDDQLKIATELNEKIEREERTLEALARCREEPRRNSLMTVAARSWSRGSRTTASSSEQQLRPFNMPKKKIEPHRAAGSRGHRADFLAHQQRKPVDVVMREIYGEDEATALGARMGNPRGDRASHDHGHRLGRRAGAADRHRLHADPDAEVGLSPALDARPVAGVRRNGKIIIPTRATTPTIAGSFVGEGLPIPVRQGLFTSQTLTPKKMAVITTWTREIDEHSVPAIEGLLRDAISQDTAISLDSVLLDSNPATVIRPAGILNGVTGLTPTAGGGFNALVGDIKQLSGALAHRHQGQRAQPGLADESRSRSTASA